MPFPVPTRTAARALAYALGTAALVVGCSKQEHPDVVIQEWVGRHLTNQWPYDAVADLRAE